MKVSTAISLAAGLILAFFAGIYGLAGLTDIEPGERGVVVKKIGEQKGMLPGSLPTGMHWIEPVTHDVIVYDARKKQYAIDPLESQTRDGQPVVVDSSLEIWLDGEIGQLHENVGEEWFRQVVFPAWRSAVRNTVPTKLSDQVYQGQHREEIQELLEKRMNAKLNDLGIYMIVNLRDIRFQNQKFIATLEEKAQAAQLEEIERRQAAAAEQRAIRVANLAEGEKQKKIKEAEAESERLRLQGVGERQQKEEIAKGNLALYEAEAEGTRLQVNAYGKGETYASVKWAENLGPNVKVYGVPTGAPGTNSLMDLNSMIGGAFKFK